MRDYDYSVKLRYDGSIDFDAYRAEAARERTKARDQFLCEAVLPFLWNAPVRITRKIMAMLVSRRSGLGATRS